ncbi:penicillin-binding protein 2 [bacterium]|nr:penicillin-binding protein 2 [bacterium]
MPKKQEQYVSSWRYVFLAALIGLIFSIIAGQLLYLQIVKGEYFRKKSSNQSVRKLWVPALRGSIYDRNGVIIAGNKPAFNLDVNVDDLTKRQITNLVKQLSSMLRKPEKSVWARLNPKKRLPYTDARLVENISFSNVVRVVERLNEIPEVKIRVRPLRDYPNGNFASHIIGYMGKIMPNHPKLLSREYSMHDRVGVSGIESICENILHGRNGKKIVQVDRSSKYVETLDYLPSVPGHNVILTIDSELQKAIEKAMSNKVGSAVAVNPKNGEILALVSTPGFDPSIFASTISVKDYKTLISDKRRPLFNRAISSRYTLGSVFKIITAIAGLESNILTPDTVFHDPGIFRLGKMRVRNYHNHNYGSMGVAYALRVSCNTFFCTYAIKIGVKNIANYARLFGFGKKTGVELPSESSGLLGDRMWKRKTKNLPWYPGDTVNLSIGHGYLIVTPIQVASMIAAVANGGIRHQPYIISGYSFEGNFTPANNEKKSIPIPIRKKNMDVIRKGLWEVTNTKNGTGRRCEVPGIVIAGKTGSAKLNNQTLAWFAAFAPFENPEIAIAVIVEDATTGGRDAAPVAQAAFIEYFGADAENVTNNNQEASN